MRNAFNVIVAAVLVAFACYGFGLAWFWQHLPTRQTLLPSHEGLVVFTGGSKRIDAALQLIDLGFNGPLLITGVHTSVSESFFLRQIAPADHHLMTIDYTAKTTRGNVAATRQWMAAQNLSRITLTTSFYHVPRSLLLLKRSGIPVENIEIYPVFPEKMTFFALLREYNKYILTRVWLI